MKKATGPALASMLALALPGVAEARPAVGLDVVRVDAETCPTAESLRVRIAERLGYDPFVGEPSVSVTVTFSPAGGSLQAVVELHEGGKSRGRRTLVAKDPDCRELADRVVLTTSIFLDAVTLDAPSSGAEAALHEPADATHAGASSGRGAGEATRSTEAPPTETWARVGLGSLVGGGFAPSASVGFFASAGVGRPRWSVDLEGRLDLPIGRAALGGTIRTSLRLAELVPCARLGVFATCAVFGAGVFSAEADGVANPTRQEAFYALVGLRPGVEIPLFSRFSLRGAFELDAVLTPPTVAVGTVNVWRLEVPVGGAIQIGLGARLP